MHTYHYIPALRPTSDAPDFFARHAQTCKSLQQALRCPVVSDRPTPNQCRDETCVLRSALRRPADESSILHHRLPSACTSLTTRQSASTNQKLLRLGLNNVLIFLCFLIFLLFAIPRQTTFRYFSTKRENKNKTGLPTGTTSQEPALCCAVQCNAASRMGPTNDMSRYLGTWKA